MRRVVGERLVERLEVLHAEVMTLMDILNMMRSGDPEPQQPQPQQQPPSTALSLLAEPPGVRQRLEAEIQFFVQQLQLQDALDDDPALLRLATASLPPSRPGTAAAARPGTAATRDTLQLQRATPPKSSSRESTSSIELLNASLNAFDLDAVVSHLREV